MTVDEITGLTIQTVMEHELGLLSPKEIITLIKTLATTEDLWVFLGEDGQYAVTAMMLVRLDNAKGN